MIDKAAIFHYQKQNIHTLSNPNNNCQFTLFIQFLNEPMAGTNCSGKFKRKLFEQLACEYREQFVCSLEKRKNDFGRILGSNLIYLPH